MERAKRFKQKTFAYESEESRFIRAKKNEQHRRKLRDQKVDKLRANLCEDVPDSDVDDTEPKECDLREKLMKWKAEKEIKKQLAMMKNKKPFVIGIPHHNFYSPKAKDPPMPHFHGRQRQLLKASPPKRITRATEKRLAMKQQEVKEQNNKTPLQVKKPNQITTKGRTRTLRKQKKLDYGDISPPEIDSHHVAIAADPDYSFKPPSGVEPLPLFGKILIPEEYKYTFEPVVYDENSSNANNVRKSLKRHSSLHSSDKNSSGSFNLSFNFSPIVSVTRKLPPEPKPTIEREKIIEEKPDEQSDQELANEAALDDTLPVLKNKLNESVKEREMLPAELSPFIVTSRGKKNARNEMRNRMGLNNSLMGEIPTKDNVMNMSISFEEEQKTVKYFKFIMKETLDDLNNRCKHWNDIQNDPELNEDAQFMINQAIGQTNLLINKKIAKFGRLISECENSNGSRLVSSKDLIGFWDMTKLEIEDLEARFAKLEELKQKNWLEEDTTEQQPKETNAKKRTAARKATKKVAGKSNMKAFIEAARKKKLEEQRQKAELEGEKEEVRVTRSSMKRKADSIEDDDDDDEDEDCLNTTASKKMKVDKVPQVVLDQTISYVNSNQLPRKSILKPSKYANESYDETEQIVLEPIVFNKTPRKASRRSCRLDKSVTFDQSESPDEPAAPETQTKDDDDDVEVIQTAKSPRRRSSRIVKFDDSCSVPSCVKVYPTTPKKSRKIINSDDPNADESVVSSPKTTKSPRKPRTPRKSRRIIDQSTMSD